MSDFLKHFAHAVRRQNTITMIYAMADEITRKKLGWWENYAPDHSSIGGKRIAAQGNLPSQCKVYVAGFRCEIFVIEIDKIK